MADVTIDGTIGTATSRMPRGGSVFVTSQTGYRFYLDGNSTWAYSKTTDGGATWGAAVQINSVGSTEIAGDVWFDQWTPGDSGTLIHTWYFDTTADDVMWRTLDTNGDTLGTERTVFAGASAVAGFGAFVSGTKTRSGYLYCFYNIDGGTEFGFKRSTDSGTTWSSDLGGSFNEGSTDICMLFPASNTGDNNDCWGVYEDTSAQTLTFKLWDSSAAAQTESATFQTLVANTTDGTGQFCYSASVRHSDGHIIVASRSERDTGTADFQVFDVTDTSTITTKTDIDTNIDDQYNPAVHIDQSNDAIYVSYQGKRDGSEVIGTTTKVYYTKSTDGGGSWTAGDTAYMEGAAAVITNVWSTLMGPRFYVCWRQGGTTLIANKVNSVVLPAIKPLTGSLSFVGSASKSTSIALSGALSFVGACTKRTYRALSASLSFVGSLATGAGAHAYQQALDATLSFAGAISKSTSHGLTGSLSFIGAIAKSTSRALSGAASFVGSCAKRTGHGISGSVSFTGSITKSIRRSLSGSLSFVGDLTKRAARTLSGSLPFVGACAKSTGKAASATLSFTGTLSKRIGKALSAALTFIGNLAREFTGQAQTYFQSLSGTLSFSGTTTKQTSRSLSGSLSFVGDISKMAGKLCEATLSSAGALTKLTARSLSSALSFVGAILISITEAIILARQRRGSSIRAQVAGSSLRAESTSGEFGATLTSFTD